MTEIMVLSAGRSRVSTGRPLGSTSIHELIGRYLKSPFRLGLEAEAEAGAERENRADCLQYSPGLVERGKVLERRIKGRLMGLNGDLFAECEGGRAEALARVLA